MISVPVNEHANSQRRSSSTSWDCYARFTTVRFPGGGKQTSFLERSTEMVAADRSTNDSGNSSQSSSKKTKNTGSESDVDFCAKRP